MKKILVTGTKGFIGKNMVSLLQNTISIVYELDAEYFDNPDWQSELKEHLVSILPDVIFHIGGHADTLEQNTNFIMERNFESTKIISDYCLLKNIPLIFSSSASCYGINNDYPSNLYGWSKYTAEQYVIKNGGIALRYFNVYGPHEEHKGIMASVAYQMYKKNYEDEDIKLFPKYPSEILQSDKASNPVEPTMLLEEKIQESIAPYISAVLLMVLFTIEELE